MNQPETPNPPPRRGPLVGLVLVVLLILAGLVLAHVLGKAARMQDCVISGRTDCASPSSPSRGN